MTIIASYLTNHLLDTKLIDVTIFSNGLAVNCLSLHAEGTVTCFETECVRSIIVNLVDLLQNRYGLRAELFEKNRWSSSGANGQCQ